MYPWILVDSSWINLQEDWRRQPKAAQSYQPVRRSVRRQRTIRLVQTLRILICEDKKEKEKKMTSLAKWYSVNTKNTKQNWSEFYLTTEWVWTGVSARWSKYESCDTERLCPLDLLLAGPGDKVSGSEFCSVLGCDSRSKAAEFRHELAPEARDSALFTGRSLRRPWASSFSVTAFSCFIKISEKSYQVVKVRTLIKDTPF